MDAYKKLIKQFLSLILMISVMVIIFILFFPYPVWLVCYLVMVWIINKTTNASAS